MSVDTPGQRITRWAWLDRHLHRLGKRIMGTVTILIRDAAPEDLAEVREMFREYATSGHLDLHFQGFEEELAALPGKYAPPRGSLLVAADADDRLVGVVAVRPLERSVCEMKRLYVRPAARRAGLARALAHAVIGRAQDLGYERMRLDTLESMLPALRLYESLGFARIDPYYPNPLPGPVYLERSLA